MNPSQNTREDVAISSSEAVRKALRERTEIALIDIRPEGRYAEGHPLFAASLPLGRLAVEVLDRIPRLTTPVVVYGDGKDDAYMGVRRLKRIGYSEVTVLEDGLDGWTASGGELFQDVNVPSKAFGELVEVTAGTPAIAPEALQEMLHTGANIAVVDARRFEEYRTMSIPTATSVPGAELVLRIAAVAPDPTTTVVVNCAGRTRSIIGAQSLINAGVPNRVMALRNGTIGWKLAGLTLDHDRGRRPGDAAPETIKRAAAAARSLARRVDVRHVAIGDLPSLEEDGRRTVYRFDVRSPEEYAVTHLAGFRSAPGGQLVQETDFYAPVRGSVVVLTDDDGVRAHMTGSWLAQMGWDVAVLEDDGQTGATEVGPWTPTLPSLPKVQSVEPALLESWLRTNEARVVDVDTSTRFRFGHVPGASWVMVTAMTGVELLGHFGRSSRIVLASADGTVAAFVAGEIPDLLGLDVSVLAGGSQGWTQSGRPLESGQDGMLSRAIDVYRRPYEGTDVDGQAMLAYLDWEFGLVAQLERDDTHGFCVLVPDA